MKDYSTNLWHSGESPEEFGIINQKGLNRKVRPVRPERFAPRFDRIYAIAAHLRLCAGQPEAPPGGLHRPFAMCVCGKCPVGLILTSLTAHILPGHRFDDETPIEETVSFCVLGEVLGS